MLERVAVVTCVIVMGCGDNRPTAAPLCGSTANDLIACVDESRLAVDIHTIAFERVPGSAHWQAVQNLCRARLEEAGYDLELHAYDTGVNVIGRRPGTKAEPADVIVSAHYDHIPGCAGADDNASGVAATLEIARLLALGDHANNVVIACWDEEELGLIGSRTYADRAKAAGQHILAMFSFDGIAFATDAPNSQALAPGFDMLFPEQTAALVARGLRGDFILAIGDERSAPITARLAAHADTLALETSVLQVSEELKTAAQTRELRRSDHASFWFAGYPGIIISDTANYRNPNYHCGNGTLDVPSTLDVGFATRVTKATLGAAFDALDDRL